MHATRVINSSSKNNYIFFVQRWISGFRFWFCHASGLLNRNMDWSDIRTGKRNCSSLKDFSDRGYCFRGCKIPDSVISFERLVSLSLIQLKILWLVNIVTSSFNVVREGSFPLWSQSLTNLVSSFYYSWSNLAAGTVLLYLNLPVQ